jgi:hypothetical protein
MKAAEFLQGRLGTYAFQGRVQMSATPDWLHGGRSDEAGNESTGISVLGLMAWIAALTAIAEALYLAHRFLG